MQAITNLQSKLDDLKEEMKEQNYLELCTLTKTVVDQLKYRPAIISLLIPKVNGRQTLYFIDGEDEVPSLAVINEKIDVMALVQLIEPENLCPEDNVLLKHHLRLGWRKDYWAQYKSNLFRINDTSTFVAHTYSGEGRSISEDKSGQIVAEYCYIIDVKFIEQT